MNIKKAIIFGANGQDGFYLRQILESKNIKPISVSRKEGDFRGDISSFDFVNSLIKENRPEYIFHMAANSTADHNALFDNHSTIGTGTVNVLESVYKNSPLSKVFITGSGLQFFNNGEPINEDTPFDSGSAYAATRIYSVYLARYYRNLGIKTYIGYLFNHESPLRNPGFISQKVIQAVKNINNGVQDSLEIGNLLIEKEWTFAGDIVEAIMLLVEQENVFETVIGTGLSYSIKVWLEVCFSLVNLNWEDYVRQSNSFTANYKKLISSPNLIKSLGWQPKVNIRQLAKMMFDY